VNASATLFAFKPTHIHGTTVSGGTTNYELTFAFSKCIADALAELEDCKAALDCVSNWKVSELKLGAGEGNIDDEHLSK